MTNTKLQPGTKRNKRPRLGSTLRQLPLLSMMIPGAILVFMFSYMPMFGIILAFKKINLRQGIFKSPWYGLGNFSYLFKSNDLWIMLRNTIGYNVMFLVLGVLIGVSLAIVLSLLRQKLASKTYQTIFIMPHFLSMVIVSYIVLAFLNMENGFVNHRILSLFGKEAVNWYIDPKPWPYILTIVHFWQGAGYGCIIYLSAIAGIDTQLYEAAEIDGANLWQQVINVTVPSLKTLVVIQLILGVGGILGGDFGLFYQVPLDSGTLSNVTTTIPVYVYKNISKGGAASLGAASATSFVQSVVGCLLVIGTNFAANKIDEESALF